MADLLTVAEYKALQGIDPTNTRDDTRISSLLPAVSRAIRIFTGRSFDVNEGVATVRSYQYDQSGILDIDDCISVTSVSTDAGVPGTTYNLDAIQWTAMPQDDSDVFYYLVITGGPYFSYSPEMGFERNLDTLGVYTRQPMVSVTAQWGWPSIPDDVQLAAAWTIAAALARKGSSASDDLTSEAISGYARSWGGKGGPQTASMAIPGHALDILVGYQRINV